MTNVWFILWFKWCYIQNHEAVIMSLSLMFWWGREMWPQGWHDCSTVADRMWVKTTFQLNFALQKFTDSVSYVRSAIQTWVCHHVNSDPCLTWRTVSMPELLLIWRIFQVTGVKARLKPLGAESMTFAPTDIPAEWPALISCPMWCFLSWQWSHFIKCKQGIQLHIPFEQRGP